MNFRYVSDIVDDVLFRAGEPVGTAGNRSSDFGAAALRYINRAYQAIWMGGSEFNPTINEDWHWLKKSTPGVLIIEPVIDTGTVAVTNNSTSITLTSAPASSVLGWYFQAEGHADVFHISAHTGGQTTATLDSVYTGVTSSAISYKLMKLEYTLETDVLKLFSPMRVYQDGYKKVQGISASELDLNYPLKDIESGVPVRFAIIGERTIRFNRYGDVTAGELIRVDYDYLYVPADLTDSASEEPVIPFQYRRILADLALYYLFMDKNDDRASAAGNSARTILSAMEIENKHLMGAISHSFGRIFPRLQNRGIEGPLRTETGLIIG